MEWPPGWIFAIAILGLGLVVVAVIGAVWASTRKKRERRSRAVVQALTASGFTATKGEPIPDEVPDWEIAPRRKRPGTAIRVQGAHAMLWLFDHTVYGKGYLGWNEETVSSGDSGTSRTYRHTLACLYSASMALPDVQVVPNIQSKMKGITTEVARSVEAEGHALPGGILDILSGAVVGLIATHERPGAIALTGLPELAAACKFYGSDESAVRALAAGPLGELLLADPSVILDGVGQWLIVSLNVGMAFGFDAAEKAKQESGLLTPEQATELVKRAFEIAACLE